MRAMMRAIPLAVLGALMMTVPSARASWVQDGVALCMAATGQMTPVSVSDGARGAVVAWVDVRNGNWDVYAQKVTVSGTPQWATDGVALCTATGYQYWIQIASDGAGGAVVAWEDPRAGNGNRNIYAQRINASGVVQWTTDGVPVCTAANNQNAPVIASDGAGGAILAWYDYRLGGPYAQIYAQRVNAAGSVQWTADGIPIALPGSQSAPAITADGAGGAVIAWMGSPSLTSWDIYAQRVNASGAVQWTIDGVLLCTATGDQYNPVIGSDGSGGAVVAWEDSRSGAWAVYAQRVNASGGTVWTTTGVAVCTVNVRQSYPSIASDGAGGALVAWDDYRSGAGYDTYAQRVTASGTVPWTPNGVPLCAATGDQRNTTIATDGTGGAIVAWHDTRLGETNNNIHAQRVDATGTVQWTNDGVPVCTAAESQIIPTIVADGVRGGIVAWSDGRSGTSHIYAQCLDAKGRTAPSAPGILSIEDVPDDQGGWARLAIASSTLDDALEPARPASGYNVWRRIDDPALLAMVSAASGAAAPAVGVRGALAQRFVEPASVAGLPLRAWNDRRFVSANDLAAAGSFPSGTWELLGSFAAYQQNQYVYLASTVADSTASGNPYSVYLVSAHTTIPSVWYVSDPDSGYSVDNLPPAAPRGLMAHASYAPAGLALLWEENAADDFSHHAIYRGTSGDFVPAPGNRLATPTMARWFDGSWSWSGGYYYKIAAVDIHDNQSGFALLAPAEIAGIDTPHAPDASYLTQNYPNPFNPTTRIAFGLKESASVALGIYDAAGRLVRVLVAGSRPAGTYAEFWDGRDANGRAVASGVYFYRLVAGGFVETRDMLLLR